MKAHLKARVKRMADRLNIVIEDKEPTVLVINTGVPGHAHVKVQVAPKR